MIKVAISFDDGRKDNYRIAEEILKPLQISATFNITTAFILNEATIKPCDNAALSKAEVMELSKNSLFEIAGHGHEHQSSKKNLILGIDNLRNWCCTANITGIASPNSKLDERSIKLDFDIYKKHGVNYIRVGSRIKTYVFIKKWARRLNRVIKNKTLFYWIYKETLLNENDDFILYSIPILEDVSYREIVYLIERAIYRNKSLILMFHSIVKPGENYYKERWSWDYNKFYKLIVKLKDYENQGKIKLLKTIDLVGVK